MPKASLLFRSDGYKYTHWKQYPPGTEVVYSYLESRGGRFPATLFFGLQYYLLEYLAGRVVTRDAIDAAQAQLRTYFSGADYLNRDGWEHLVAAHDGRLPVRIRAVPEGAVIPVSNVLMTIENTDPRCYWLPNYLETLLLKVWYPTTVATLSRAIKRRILQYLEETGDPTLIEFKLHDFGYRGTSSEESAAIGGLAHLVNFRGSDTLLANLYAQDYYGATAPVSASIPAAEHSTITSWGPEQEAAAYANILDQFPTGSVSVVSDSYDIVEACERYWGTDLKARVLARAGTVVIRPDSGDPASTVLRVLAVLGEKFGTQRNDKGYVLLDPHVRLIQGDAVNYDSIGTVLQGMKRAGWSADNLTFGMGGALLQQVNRDTQEFAFKCASVTVNGQEREVYKTAPGKRSKRGRLALIRRGNGYATVRGRHADDLLQTVFENGRIVRRTTFAEVVERAGRN